MRQPYRLKSTVGPAHDMDPDDVWATKHNLVRKGYYSAPSYGMTEYPDYAMIESLKRFQRDNGLRIDGIAKPGGETEERLITGKEFARLYVCTICTARHGGVHSPLICWQCWGKGHR
jgi:hypothetical protein